MSETKTEDGRTYDGAGQTVIGILKRDFGFARIEFESHGGTAEFTPERTGPKFAKLDLDDDYLFTIYETVSRAIGATNVSRWIDEDGTTTRITIAAAGYLEPVGVFDWISYRGEMETRTYRPRANSRKVVSHTGRKFHSRREDLIFVRESLRSADEIARYGHVLESR